jgi:hypothetical protein
MSANEIREGICKKNINVSNNKDGDVENDFVISENLPLRLRPRKQK